MTESERAAFEAWAEREGFNIQRDDSDKYCEYHRTTTRWAWQAWQARAAHGVAIPLTGQPSERSDG